MSTRGNHNVNRLSISSRPELPGTSCSLRVKATCYSLMSLGSGTAAIPKLLQVPFVTWCSSLIFLAPALAAWKLSPKCPLLDRIWHYPCKDNPFVQDIQKPRLAMVAHRQIDLFDPFWGSSRASHSNNDGIWRDFSNFPPTRHQLMLLHRGNRQWLPPAEFPPWPQAPQAPVRSNASGGKSIPPIVDVILYLMWCNVINQMIIMNSYNKHLGMVWIPFMVTLGMVHDVYALGFTRFTTCNWRTWVYQWEVPSAREIYHLFFAGDLPQ